MTRTVQLAIIVGANVGNATLVPPCGVPENDPLDDAEIGSVWPGPLFAPNNAAVVTSLPPKVPCTGNVPVVETEIEPAGV